jgi:selenocysteine lyase/cysteine desulfurase
MMSEGHRSTSGVDRRGFLSRLGGSVLAAGLVAPNLELLAAIPAAAATPGSVFQPQPGASNAAIFAEARKHFLIPVGVTYCNTGTLGACPREVVDALANGTRALEARLADWAYLQPEGEPLTGYEPSLGIRTVVGSFINVVSGLGTRMPARELCSMIRDHGALALVDGAQAVGQMEVDVKALGCDAYVASPHKWMMAPKGTGFLYIRRDIQDRFWTTLASSHWDDRESGAFRFMQYGTGSVPVHEGLAAAMAFVQKIGIQRIERWDSMLTKRLRDGLGRIPTARLSSPSDPRLASAITTFRIEGVKARALQEALWTRKIRVRPQNDARGVRLSAHIYMSPADVDNVLDVASKLRPA